MPRPRAYRANKGVDVGPDWSPSHFIIGIAVASVFGILCFVIGYVVAINDRPLAPDDVVADKSPVAVTPPGPEERERANPGGRGSTNAAQEANSADAEEPAGVRRPPATPPALAPLPPSGGGPTPMVKTPVNLPGADSGESGTTTTASKPPAVASRPLPDPNPPAPNAPTAATKPSEVTPPAAPAKPASTPEVTPPKPAAKPTPPPAPNVTKGSWAIQVAFFDGPDRKQQARTIQKRLESSTDHEATLLASNDEKEYRVIIGGFTTPEAAKKVCESLKSKTGFSDAWVKRLP